LWELQELEQWPTFFPNSCNVLERQGLHGFATNGSSSSRAFSGTARTRIAPVRRVSGVMDDRLIATVGQSQMMKIITCD
jgi:hypothetical protein